MVFNTDFREGFIAGWLAVIGEYPDFRHIPSVEKRAAGKTDFQSGLRQGVAHAGELVDRSLRKGS